MERSPLTLPHRLDLSTLTCRAVVETPFGSRAKLVFDEESGLYAVGKLMPEGLSFPFDFGFIPSTCGGDGDALDVIVLHECELPVGCAVDVRLLGLIEVEQWREGEPKLRNDRLIARLSESHLFAQVQDLSDLPPNIVERWNGFFAYYKRVRGQSVKVLAMKGARPAAEMILSSGQ